MRAAAQAEKAPWQALSTPPPEGVYSRDMGRGKSRGGGEGGGRRLLVEGREDVALLLLGLAKRRELGALGRRLRGAASPRGAARAREGRPHGLEVRGQPREVGGQRGLDLVRGRGGGACSESGCLCPRCLCPQERASSPGGPTPGPRGGRGAQAGGAGRAGRTISSASSTLRCAPARHCRKRTSAFARQNFLSAFIATCRPETCLVSTGGGTRRVQLVREEGRDVSS